MIRKKLFFIVFSVLLTSKLIEGYFDCRNNDDDLSEDHKILSRHRRYLIFPEGSSLQLGNICLTENLLYFTRIFCYLPKHY